MCIDQANNKTFCEICNQNHNLLHVKVLSVAMTKVNSGEIFFISVAFLSWRLPTAKHVDMIFNHILLPGYY